jgi:hypothetical protein
MHAAHVRHKQAPPSRAARPELGLRNLPERHLGEKQAVGSGLKDEHEHPLSSRAQWIGASL